MPARKISKEKESELIDLYLYGKSSNEIAKIYGYANGSIICKILKKNGIKLRNLSEAQKKTFENGRKSISYWKGKTQSESARNKKSISMMGEKNPKYKDGTSSRKYREQKNKILCDICSGVKNLGIHHIDFDHYNDSPENLQVLCVNCHMSLHKTEYWRCKKLGLEYRNNSPIGWTR